MSMMPAISIGVHAIRTCVHDAAIKTSGIPGYNLHACWDDKFEPEFYDQISEDGGSYKGDLHFAHAAYRSTNTERKNGGDWIVLPGTKRYEADEESDHTHEVTAICRTRIPTGLSFDVPSGYIMQIYPSAKYLLDEGPQIVSEVLHASNTDEIFISVYNIGLENCYLTNGGEIARILPIEAPMLHSHYFPH